MRFGKWHVIGLLAVVLLLVLGSIALAQGPTKWGPSPKYFQPVGRSGILKIYPSGDRRQFIMLKQARLVEVDELGNRVPGHAVTLSGPRGKWSISGPGTISGGVSCISAQYDGKFTIDGKPVDFTLYVDLLPGAYPISSTMPISGITPVSSTATLAGEQLLARPDAVKLSIEVSNWPFSSTLSKLQYGVVVEPKGGAVRDRATGLKKRVYLEPVLIDGVATAVLDDAVDAPVAIDFSYTQFAAGKKVAFKWAFPAFVTNLKYNR